MTQPPTPAKVRRAGAHVALALLAGSWLLGTALRVPIWTNERLLWADAAAKAPHKPRPWINFGKQAHLDGDYDVAIDAYQLAITLTNFADRSARERYGSWLTAQLNLSLATVEAGHPTAAQRLIAVAYQRAPHDKDVATAYEWINSRVPPSR